MSLFGSFMGDDDIFNMFGPPMNTMRHMSNMMNSLFNDPLMSMMGQNALMHHNRGLQDSDMSMSLFNPNYQRFGFSNITSDGNCHSFMSQSVMTMSSGPDGRPQVYQETMSTRTAPGGIKETKKTVSDSRTGTRKMAIGHHIGERAHILERERNMRGDEEERQEFINLDEDEAETFNQEWESHTRRGTGAINAPNAIANNRYRPEPRQLALPSTTEQPASEHSNRGIKWFRPKHPVRSLLSSKAKNTSHSSKSKTALSSRAELSAPYPTGSGSRKREHKLDSQVSNKRRAGSHSDD